MTIAGVYESKHFALNSALHQSNYTSLMRSFDFLHTWVTAEKFLSIPELKQIGVKTLHYASSWIKTIKEVVYKIIGENMKYIYIII